MARGRISAVVVSSYGRTVGIGESGQSPPLRTHANRVRAASQEDACPAGLGQVSVSLAQGYGMPRVNGATAATGW